jgi:hypothetical protein
MGETCIATLLSKQFAVTLSDITKESTAAMAVAQLRKRCGIKSAKTHDMTLEAYPVDSGSSICSKSAKEVRLVSFRGFSRLTMSQ